MRLATFSSKFNIAALLVIGSLAATACAQSGAVKTDAQVEANVLRALAGAPELSTQNIQSTTTYGVVTLTGSVQDEGLRSKAENLAARADGVKKVVDELSLGDATVASNEQQPANQPGAEQGSAMPAPNGGQDCVLQSDGTCAPADATTQQAENQPLPPAAENGNTSVPAENSQGGYPQRRPLYGNQNPNYPPQGQGDGPPRGQQAGLPVVVPAGAVLHIRINRGLVTGHVQPGTTFDATVLNDIVAGGAIAIPRGAAITGTVVDAEKAGVLKGRGELALQLNGLTLGGQQYALVTDTWTRTGADKTTHTVNSALGYGVLGAIIGGVAGGGRGAAIGAGVGAGAGVASSAASPGGQVIVPPESVLTFKLAQPAQVATVSQSELQRLAYAAGPPAPVRTRRRGYPAYYAPGGYYAGQ